MKKLYPLSFARDETTTLLKNSIETSAGIMSSTFAEAAIVYFFCPSLRCCYDVSKVGGAYAPAMERCILEGMALFSKFDRHFYLLFC